MVYHRIKRIKNRTYNYLVHNFKFHNKIFSIQKYIGPGKLKKADINKEKVKHKVWFLKETIKKKASISSKEFKSTIISAQELLFLELLLFGFKEYRKGFFPNEMAIIERNFDINYVHSTTATEGNTCTLRQVTRILDSNISPKGKSLREVYEIRNFTDVLSYRKEYRGDLTKDFILKLHELIMRDVDIHTRGTFRRIEVAITGSSLRPTPPPFIEGEIDDMIGWYNKKKRSLHPIELASRVHIWFETIHPFTDGNGRVGREIFNFVVTKNKYPPLNFDVRYRNDYLDALEAANRSNDRDFIIYVLKRYYEQMSVRLRKNPMKKVFSEFWKDVDKNK